MIRFFIAVLVLCLWGCSGDFTTSEQLLDDEPGMGGTVGDGDGLDGAGGSDSAGGSDTTGGSDGIGGSDSAGGSDGTGGVDGTGGADGTGGTSVVGPDCYPLWDASTTYLADEDARVQVGENIYQACDDSFGSTPDITHTDPQTCKDDWRWIATCPSQRCEDALPWVDGEMEFWPPVYLGTLFSYEGEIWELTSWQHTYGASVYMSLDGTCGPNPAPEDYCNVRAGFTLAEQCL